MRRNQIEFTLNLPNLGGRYEVVAEYTRIIPPELLGASETYAHDVEDLSLVSVEPLDVRDPETFLRKIQDAIERIALSTAHEKILERALERA